MPTTIPGLQVLIESIFDHNRFLALLCNFIVFEDDGSSTTTKELTEYHRFIAVTDQFRLK